MSFQPTAEIAGLRLAPLPARHARWNQHQMWIDREYSHPPEMVIEEDGSVSPYVLKSAAVNATVLWRFDLDDELEIADAALADEESNDGLVLPEGMGVALTEDEQARAYAEISQEHGFNNAYLIMGRADL